MNWEMIWEAFLAFNKNALARFAYGITNNWWLILLILAAIVSAIFGIIEYSDSVVREEQNIL